MNEIIEKILLTKEIVTDTGKIIELNSSIDENEVNFLTTLIKNNPVKTSIEVGCAMGISSIAISEAIKTNFPSDSHHTIIDPFQSTDWQNIGITNLKRAGLDNYSLYEERSEFILPKLAESGFKVDFGFIDGWHTFDHTLIDFFYINRMLNVNGIVVIDDVGMPAVSKVARLIHQYDAYEFVGSVKHSLSGPRKILENIKSTLRPFAKLSGTKASSEIFNSSVLKSDRSLGLDASMIAFRKIQEDKRPWNWHKNF